MTTLARKNHRRVVLLHMINSYIRVIDVLVVVAAAITVLVKQQKILPNTLRLRVSLEETANGSFKPPNVENVPLWVWAWKPWLLTSSDDLFKKTQRATASHPPFLAAIDNTEQWNVLVVVVVVDSDEALRLSSRTKTNKNKRWLVVGHSHVRTCLIKI